eukprot:7077903-Pyramimonas_sp.AAC.1
MAHLRGVSSPRPIQGVISAWHTTAVHDVYAYVYSPHTLTSGVHLTSNIHLTGAPQLIHDHRLFQRLRRTILSGSRAFSQHLLSAMVVRLTRCRSNLSP